MAKCRAFLLWAVWLLLGWPLVDIWAAPVKIAVMPFNIPAVDGGGSSLIRNPVETQVSQALKAFKRFHVISGHGYHSAAASNPSDHAPLTAEVMITGLTDQVRGKSHIHLQAVSFPQQAVLASIRLPFDDGHVQQAQIQTWASQLVKLFPLTGMVLERSRDRISINIGKNEGLEPDTFFLVGSPRLPPAEQGPPYRNVGLVQVREVDQTRSSALILNYRLSSEIQKGYEVREIDEPLEKGYGFRLDRTAKWEAMAQPPLVSALRQAHKKETVWQYRIPAQNAEGWANLFLYLEPVAVEKRKLTLWLTSRNGHRIRIRLYSFLPGISEAGEIDSYVPIEREFPLIVGRQEIVLDYTRMNVPRWWREGHLEPRAKFNARDVRVLELEAEAWPSPKTLEDILEIRQVVLW